MNYTALGVKKQEIACDRVRFSLDLSGITAAIRVGRMGFILQTLKNGVRLRNKMNCICAKSGFAVYITIAIKLC